MSVDPHRAGPRPSGAWAGWVAFAGIMLSLIGFFDILQGLTALTNDTYFVVDDRDLLVFDFTTWGWILLLWGVLLIACGLGLLATQGWARWLGVAVAFINALARVAFLAAYPIWATIVIALDIIVLFALTARWEEARLGLRE
jgi:hypothetical protein